MVIKSLSEMLVWPSGYWLIEIFALVLHHDDETAMGVVEKALAEGVGTITHVLKLPHRMIDADEPHNALWCKKR